LPKIFERLYSGIKSDVAVRNKISAEATERLEFGHSREGPDRILVTRSGTKIRTVEFILRQASIGVEGEAQFEADPGLNNPGDCTLTVNGTELELWAVRRLALEKLFFSNLSTLSRVTVNKA
jgi:hypothetical protein